MAWLQSIAGPVAFTEGGALSAVVAEHPAELRLLFFLFVAGLGVKAALVPLHGWLPKAMVAPAPVSSLLHAVAVVKAGAFGLVRLVYDVYGIETARDLESFFGSLRPQEKGVHSAGKMNSKQIATRRRGGHETLCDRRVKKKTKEGHRRIMANQRPSKAYQFGWPTNPLR